MGGGVGGHTPTVPDHKRPQSSHRVAQPLPPLCHLPRPSGFYVPEHRQCVGAQTVIDYGLIMESMGAADWFGASSLRKPRLWQLECSPVYPCGAFDVLQATWVYICFCKVVLHVVLCGCESSTGVACGLFWVIDVTIVIYKINTQGM